MTKILKALGSDPFLEGFARAFDLFGVLRQPMPYPSSSHNPDQDAMWRDWSQVGSDLHAATQQAEEELVGPT